MASAHRRGHADGVSYPGDICILGYGEVGQILADDLAPNVRVPVRAYDPLFATHESGPGRAVASTESATESVSAAEAAAGCDLVISVVTADEAVAAARSVAGSLKPGCVYFDLNSVSPKTTVETASVVQESGGRFVEGVIMTSIGSHRIRSPILLGGRNASAFESVARSLGFTGVRVFSDELGAASAVKMCRSVIVKGLEALLGEALVTAQHYGVVDDVLASLDDLLPVDSWEETARYMISRSVRHGERRAAEMREVAATVADVGLEPLMSESTVGRQEWAARFESALEEDLDGILDALLSRRDTDG